MSVPQNADYEDTPNVQLPRVDGGWEGTGTPHIWRGWCADCQCHIDNPIHVIAHIGRSGAQR